MVPKILFIVPPNKAANNKIRPYEFPHMGIAYLMSYLKERNIDAKVVDASLKYSDKDNVLVSAISEYKPHLIGLSLYSNVIKEGLEIINVVKKHFSIPIVVGGPHVCCTKDDFLRKSSLDYGIVKEGERPLYNLIKNLFIDNKDDKERQIEALYNIKGIIFRNNKGEFIINENDDLIEDLDSVPYPDYFSFGIENYACYRSKHLTLVTSRGCPYRCTYCAAPLCTGNKFRMRSAKKVVDEMEFWTRHGVKSFGIFDDSFNQNLERAKEICNELIKRDLGITFDLANGLRANKVDKELFVLLKKAGCTLLGFGMESGNEQILKSIRKKLRKEDMINAINFANEAGIKTAVNFILGHPGETYQTAMDTLDFAKQLKCSYVNMYFLVPIPGTEAYEILKRTANFFYDETSYLNNISTQSIEPIFDTQDFPKEERRRIYRLGRDISRRSVFRFRFGGILGSFIYILLYNDKIFNFVQYFRETGWLGRFYDKIRKS